MPFTQPADQMPTDAHLYRFGHSLAQSAFDFYKRDPSVYRHICFDYGALPQKISILQPLIGESGFLLARHLQIESLETEDFVLFAGMTAEGMLLDAEQCRRLFSLIGKELQTPPPMPSAVENVLKNQLDAQADAQLQASLERNAHC